MRLTTFVYIGAFHSAVAFNAPPANLFSTRVASLSRRNMVERTTENPLSAIFNVFSPPNIITNAKLSFDTASVSEEEQIVTSFIDALNTQTSPTELLRHFDDNISYIDTAYYKVINGKEELLKHWLLHRNSSPLSTFSKYQIVIDDTVSSSDGVYVMYHLITIGGETIQDSTHITFYRFSQAVGANKIIQQVFDVAEPTSPKPGDVGLNVLKAVSSLIGDNSIIITNDSMPNDNSKSNIEQYFEAWNRRDMKRAISLFSPDCQMRDLQYDDAFSGREEFEKHLLRVKDCLPPSFSFVVDEIAVTKSKAGVLWHVENNGVPLAFTRGCSFYLIDKKNGLIASGYEIPEKAPPKTGYINTLMAKFEAEPVRFLPAVIWVVYMYVLFISDGILPGANALALEQRTWEEVRDLSLNFFLVAPTLNLPFSPVVHPMLEGVFNLLLAWAAMFAGFLSDERKDKPNLLPFGPILIGMQFLTSGFLLPYLFTRSIETKTQAYIEDIDGDIQTLIAEWRPLGGLLGVVGTASIYWGFFARPEFGAFSERYASFGDLLSIDRVGSSFIVDLIIFAIFQSWFVDDDLKRRGVFEGKMMVLRNIAKYIPFFGLAVYLMARPQLFAQEYAE